MIVCPRAVCKSMGVSTTSLERRDAPADMEVKGQRGDVDKRGLAQRGFGPIPQGHCPYSCEFYRNPRFAASCCGNDRVPIPASRGLGVQWKYSATILQLMFPP